MQGGEGKREVGGGGKVWEYACVGVGAKGFGVGSVFGGLYNALFGGSNVVVIGDPVLRNKMRLRGVLSAGGRIGGIFALYGVSRCFFSHEGILPSAAPMAAGAMAVGVPYALNPQRQQFFQQFFKDNMRGMKIGRPLAVAMACVSGSVVFGTADFALSFLGLDWWKVDHREWKLLQQKKW